jgi:hypothetical protein
VLYVEDVTIGHHPVLARRKSMERLEPSWPYEGETKKLVSPFLLYRFGSSHDVVIGKKSNRYA